MKIIIISQQVSFVPRLAFLIIRLRLYKKDIHKGERKNVLTFLAHHVEYHCHLDSGGSDDRVPRALLFSYARANNRRTERESLCVCVRV